MNIPSIHEMKEELLQLDNKQLIAICLKLAKARVENKEHLSYLLFFKDSEQLYVNAVKEDMNDQMNELNKSSFYLAKKTIRKVLRTANRYSKFSTDKETGLQLKIHFCELVKRSGIQISKHQVLANMYQNQMNGIRKIVSRLDEDLQFDYKLIIENLESE